ncbi:type VI secretion system tip protein VgrG [Vibrio sp.]|nr:type VI secretion system tip protein VgrG [Vibrio sp.]
MASKMHFEFEILDSELEFRVESFNVNEALSQPYSVNLTLLSENPNIVWEEVVQQPAVLRLLGQGAGTSRLFHGVVHTLRYLGEGRRFSRYQLTVFPTLKNLEHRSDSRIFQSKTVKEIITEVLADAGINDVHFVLQDNEHDTPLDYVLQYNETDLAFFNRLLAENGMWYYFEHNPERHAIVIANQNAHFEPLPNDLTNSSYIGALYCQEVSGGNSDREHVNHIEVEHHVQTEHTTYRDYNYQKATQKIEQESGFAESPLKQFLYPGRFQENARGGHLVNHAQLNVDMEKGNTTFSSDIMRLQVGYKTELCNHRRDSVNTEYNIVSITHQGMDTTSHEEEASDGAMATYSNHVIVLKHDVEVKSAPRSQPLIQGTQTAVVVGPQGEEIYTDEQGRVKVQFHWDRYGAKDENAGCWVRVSQTLAGTGWGSVFTPRVGQEVVVTFLEGDADRPLITGVVYNSSHSLPYALPEEKTRTVIRTQTYKGTGYNELSFDDRTDEEEIYIRAQKDMVEEIQNNRFRLIGQNDKLEVKADKDHSIEGNQTELIKGNKQATVEGTFTETVVQDVKVDYQANETKHVGLDSTLTVDQSRNEAIKMDDNLNVTKNRSVSIGQSHDVKVGSNETIDIGSNLSINVGGNTLQQSGGTTAISSGNSITLSVGAASLIMNSDGTIQLSGSNVTVNGSAFVGLSAPSVSAN